MNNKFILLAVLAASPILRAQQLAALAILPGSPILMQLTPVSASAAGQVKDDLFAGTEKFAQGASESTEVNLDPDSMNAMSSGHEELARKMKFMVIHSYKYDKPGMYKMDDVEIFRKKLEDGTWKCSIRVREKNESTDICSRVGPDHEAREMVIISAEPQELTFIHMSGNMSLDDLNKSAKGLQKR